MKELKTSLELLSYQKFLRHYFREKVTPPSRTSFNIEFSKKSI